MPINKLEFSTILMTKLDQHVLHGATTNWMENNAGQVKYNGGNEVKIPTMSTTGLGDYDRDKGFVQGSVTLSYETYKMTQDRGRTFHLDRMDVDETNFVANATSVMGVFQTEQVIPEIDSYRYSTIASILAGTEQTYEETITASNVYTKLVADIRKIQNKIGGDKPLVITISYEALAALEDSDKYQRHIRVDEFNSGGIRFSVKSFDGHAVIPVPSARFKTKYDILDGVTGGQEQGGLKPATGAKDINWIISTQTAPIAISKTDKVRIFTPDENQDADAWKLDYRKYHDLWIPKNKQNQLVVCTAKGVEA